MESIKDIAIMCKAHRRRLKVKQATVALETGYSPKTISAFECGKLNNAKILMWYINSGMGEKNNGKAP